MITPDDKDWTWVLDRPCPDCGFDATTTGRGEVAALVRSNAAAWQARLDAGVVRSGRPDDSTWSTLEYACHVRDVYRIYDERLGRMLREDDPLFPNWDQDVAAVEERYDEQDPSTVVDDLASAASQAASTLEDVDGDAWDRPGRRSDGASFTVDTLARYMVHDPIHHLWDVDRITSG